MLTKINYFSLSLDTLFGAYISYNYNILNVKEEFYKFLKYLESLEK